MSTPTDTDDAIGAVATCAAALERQDIVESLRVAVERSGRAQTYVVVMGEFKQGKSSLVNALVGRTVCPFDDDTATAVVTMVERGDRDGSWVARGETLEPTLDSAAVIRGRSDRPVDHVRLHVERTELPEGLTLIDTPGVGGLDGGHTIATLAFLPYADAVLFVSDATAEYSAAEMAWLERARDTGARVVPVLTKADLAPSWRRIAELDRGHLDRRALEVPIAVTSAALHQVALDVGDPTLADESGIPALRRHLVDEVTDPARAAQQQRAVATARRMARVIADQLRLETELLGDRTTEAGAAEAAARSRLEHLRGPATKWQQRLGDRSADITNAATFAFRSAVRTLGQSIDERVDALESPSDWAGFAHEFQMELADAATRAFEMIDADVAVLRRELFETVGQLAPTATSVSWEIDTPELESLTAVTPSQQHGPGRTMSAVRGAQSGVMLFGFLGQMLPAAAGALLLSSPITLVLGGAFAGKALLDVRKRSLTVRRAQLKTAARKVLDDAQFDLGNRVSEHVRSSVRAVRDEVGDALSVATRTESEALANAKRLVESTESERTQRLAELRAIAAQLRAADAILAVAR